MSCAKSITLYQGADWSQVWRWSESPLVYKDVTAVTASTPLTLTVTAHGVLDGWPVAMTELGGFDDTVNADGWPPDDDDDFFAASVVDTNTLAFKTLDAARAGTYTSGGKIAYYTPVDLTGATGVLNIYPYPSISDTPETVAVGAVTFDNTAKTITAGLTATQTAALTDEQYAFYLVITVGGLVTVLATGVLDTKALGASP